LTTLKTYYKALFDFSDPNLFKISQTVIDDFTARKIVPDEIERKKLYSNKKSLSTPSATSNANTLTIPKRNTSKIPANFPIKPRGAASGTVTTPPSSAGLPIIGQTGTVIATAPVVPQPRVLVWQKPSLSQSDAQFVLAGTNGTGNLKLSQARFKVNGIVIDHNTYFRNQVFQSLNWARTKPTSATYEETICNFIITILGTSYGVQALKLSYDTVRISNQANTPSWLHWGNTLMSILQQINVTGRALNLYKVGQNFHIEIV